jgi:hypothetical protein
MAASTATTSNVTATPCEYDVTYNAINASVRDLCAGSARVRSAFTWHIKPAATQPVRLIELNFSSLALLAFDSLSVIDDGV